MKPMTLEEIKPKEYWSDKLPHTARVKQTERYRFHYAPNGAHNVDINSKTFAPTDSDVKVHWEVIRELKAREAEEKK
jgi:hypothetical protein